MKLLFTGLPGGILVGIRIAVCPLREVASCPGTWAALAEQLATMPEEMARYKGPAAGIPAVLREMERHAPLRKR